MPRTLPLLIVSLLLISPTLAAAEEGFTPLFNGRDFSNWINVNCAPSTWSVKDGEIYCTGIPTGLLRTDRMYENFILELEWKHLKKNGNAGLFVYSNAITARGQPFSKSIEVQIIDSNHPQGWATSHGDVFAIHGATFVPDRAHPQGWMRCLPSEKRAKPAGEWNHYRVESRDGRLSLAVNGKVVSGGTKCVPRKGYIVLESEGSPVLFKNIRIKELPTSNPPAEEVAEADQGYKSLYTGVDLSGWQTEPGDEAHWNPKDWILACTGPANAKARQLRTDKSYTDFSLIVDWRTKEKLTHVPVIIRGTTFPAGDSVEPARWNRAVLTVKGGTATIIVNDRIVTRDHVIPDADRTAPIALESHGAGIDFANIYIDEIPRP